jgi:hypothetical protein
MLSSCKGCQLRQAGVFQVFRTYRLRLIKIAARVDEHKKRIRIRLPTACPHQPIQNLCVERLPRLRLLT